MEQPALRVPRRLDASALADELLEEIFLRIGSPADLVRTSAACSSFRRIITTGRYFLRRYRSSVHRPFLLGFVHPEGFEPARPPHPSAPVARALVRAADFSFDHLPSGRWPKGWRRCDARDGLVLLECAPDDNSVAAAAAGVFPDLAVCDPLSRRYVLLPHIPDGLAASAQIQQRNLPMFEASLVPCGDEETKFRVIGKSHSVSELVVFVFSSDSGQWRLGDSTTWGALNLNLSLPTSNHSHSTLRCSHYSAYGCFFWKLDGKNKLLTLDLSKMKFSTVDLPSNHEEKQVAIVEAGEGRLGMLSGMHSSRAIPAYYYYVMRRNKGDGVVQEWRMEGIVLLSKNHRYSTIGVADGYILLCRVPNGAHTSGGEYLSLEVKTFKLEWVSALNQVYRVYPYVGFPPSLSPRRI